MTLQIDKTAKHPMMLKIMKDGYFFEDLLNKRVADGDASNPHDFTGEPNSFEEFRLSLSNL